MLGAWENGNVGPDRRFRSVSKLKGGVCPSAMVRSRCESRLRSEVGIIKQGLATQSTSMRDYQGKDTA